MAGLTQTIIAAVLAGQGFGLSAMAAEPRLWDQEPALWEAAKSYQIERPLAPVCGWEGPVGMPQAKRKPGEGPSGEGVNISNGRLQSSLWGTPDRLVLSVAKTDVHNRAAIRKDSSKKPVGQILLLAGDFAGAAQPQVTTAVQTGVNRLEFAKDGAKATIEYLLGDKETNVLAIRARMSGVKQAPALRLFRHKDNQLPDPTGGDDGSYFWLQQKFAPEKTFPDGFDYYLVGKVVGRPVTIRHANMQPQLGAPVPCRDPKGPGTAATAQLAAANEQEFTVYLTVVTRAEADDPLAQAKRRLQDAAAAGWAGLVSRNQQRYHELFAAREKGRIFTGHFADVREVVMPFIYQAEHHSRHTYTSNPDPTRYEADANYNSLESDQVSWYGLQCFNEELYTPDFVVGRDETAGDYYVKLFNFWRPAWEAYAKSKGMAGLYVVRGYVPPIKNDVYWSPAAAAMNGCDWCTMVFAFKNVWDAYDYGGKDQRFLREQVYPSLRDIAEFFAQRLKLEQDGYYHLEPSQIREEAIGRDAIDCIGAAKWALRTADKAAGLLGVDRERRAVWRERLAKVKPYYVIKNAQGEPVFASLVAGKSPVVAGHGASHFLTNVVDEINLESPPELRQLAIRSNLHHHEQPMNRQVEYLLGESRDTLQLSPNYSWIHFFGHPPWLMYYAQKSGIGDFGKTMALQTRQQKTLACWLEPERLCNSRSETIFFFPAVPSGLDIAFKDFQARNGFLVSGEYRAGKVSYALIKARRSGPCAVMNPWPDRPLGIRQQPGNVAVAGKAQAGGKVIFETKAGASYLLTP